ncbi:hypothetical protein ARMGADRAFT_653263 [Armillaria gallica]|uniref:Uncharacterized protein n=1 Tax=Armillaria gallica TaxID=47427 RepID=A0A2H3EE68_ARMGA|nr:hypothetical protein ARMGADRAFT_653263 [Armillaria gallica]
MQEPICILSWDEYRLVHLPIVFHRNVGGRRSSDGGSAFDGHADAAKKVNRESPPSRTTTTTARPTGPSTSFCCIAAVIFTLLTMGTTRQDPPFGLKVFRDSTVFSFLVSSLRSVDASWADEMPGHLGDATRSLVTV